MAEPTWTPKEFRVELQRTGRIPLRCPHSRRGVPGLRDAAPQVVEFGRVGPQDLSGLQRPAGSAPVALGGENPGTLGHGNSRYMAQFETEVIGGLKGRARKTHGEALTFRNAPCRHSWDRLGVGAEGSGRTPLELPEPDLGGRRLEQAPRERYLSPLWRPRCLPRWPARMTRQPPEMGNQHPMWSWRSWQLFSRMCPAAFAIAFCGACEGSSAGFAQPVYFQASDSAYVIRSVDARVGQGEADAEFDETRVLFGSILDVDKTPSGWAVVDGLNRHIVLLDSVLNPLRIVGRVGEGPGEYEAPSQLSMLGDTMSVFDMSTGRVSYLSPQGDFLRISEPAGRYAMAFAIHPKLGRFFPILSREH